MNITRNKKGFTLVELIAAVTIMAILGSIVVVSFKTLNANRKEKEYNEYKRQVENAACTYISLDANSLFRSSCGSSCNITASRLIEQGLISSELVNPKTNSPIDPSESVDILEYTKCTYHVSDGSSIDYNHQCRNC